MGETADLYAIAQTNDIEIYRVPLPETESLSAEINGRCCIGIDSTRRMTGAQERAHLGHELGHCLYGGFYTRGTPYDLVERHEVRADRWYIRHAIPRRKLYELLRQGRDAWEIAEMLDTTEEYVRQAYYFYRQNEEER